MSIKLKIVVTKERLRKYVSIDEMVSLQSNDLGVVKNVIARFAVDENNEFYPVKEVDGEFGTDYIAHPTPLKIIGKLNTEKIEELMKSFMGNAEDAAVPPVNASDSEGQSSQEPAQPPTG